MAADPDLRWIVVRERWTVRWFRKRALLYHLIVAVLVPGCLLAGWWQIHRAEGGNTLSYLYAVEWPIFAVLSIVGWWQLIHEDPAAVESRKVERARRAVNRGPFVPPPPDAGSGFFHPLASGRYGALDTGDAGTTAAAWRSLPVAVDAGRAGPGGGGRGSDDDGPFGPPVDAEEVAVHSLSSYNAYLARLSAGGGRKSWRNPHGLSAGGGRTDPGAAVAAGAPAPHTLEGPSPPEVGPGSGGVLPADPVGE